MTELDETANYSSDDEVNPQAHKKLLYAVNRIGKTQHIKKPLRSEPSLAQDEFHLVKSAPETAQKAEDSAVFVSDLVKLLNKTEKHLAVGKELRKTKANRKVLPKPLERPVAEKIRRQIGYESLKKQLSKWDAVVERNKVAEQQVFPLGYEEIRVEIKKTNKTPQRCIKSDLMKKFEEIEAEYKPKTEITTEEDEEKQLQDKLTKEELIARRKKLAYLRMQESQKSSKARLRNKIKSKKYHKLLKRQKLKEQMQEFEALQKINPEAALEKLEQIEKNRVLERANLRHKNTGTWAKNLKVRAKYDKDVQKDLADQLALSRELTAKFKKEDEEDSVEGSDDEQDEGDEDPFNPWMKSKKKNEVAEFVTGYRKYWNERNKNMKELEEHKKDEGNSPQENGDKNALQENKDNDAQEKIEDDQFQEIKNEDERVRNSDSEDQLKERGDESEQIKNEDKNDKNKKNSKGIEKKKQKQSLNKTKKKNLKIKKTKPLKNGWLEEKKDIDDIFDAAEEMVQKKVEKKLKKLSKALQTGKGKDRNDPAKSTKKDHLDLSFKKKVSRPQFDEELQETSTKDNDDPNSNEKILNDIQKVSTSGGKIENPPDKHVETIDPNNFVTIKARTFKSELADIINSGDFLEDADDDDEAIDKQLSLATAFEDEDIEADFQKEREEDRKKDVSEVDLSLPGWGSWAGCGMCPKKRKRFVLKFPAEEKRRDDNKERVVINENMSKKLKEHLVSDLPFPFTSVKDYEASIRAPVGPDFVPETAFRVLTRPAVITKMGQIIEPMAENELLKTPKKPRHVVDKRIAKLNEGNDKNDKKIFKGTNKKRKA